MKALGLNFIDVNVSTIQAVDDQMAKRYIDIMKKYQVDPKYIRLEITESAVITNRTALISNMNELVEYGVHFALDDYGVGNSNISYLTTLPIKCVKIDKSFTELFFTDDKANYIVKNEIEMFNGLDLIVVFEGVEEKYQLDGLLKLDIDYIQGFYYSKPISEEEFLSFIKETQK
jgi:EAL domain-containing protein (putative c-di-GMP-specific phosphodiesterase class I)